MLRKLNHSYFHLFLIWGLILEFPVRYLLSPDPWLASSDSWYFSQPLRLIIEVFFVIISILPILYIKRFRESICLNLNKDKLIFIAIGSIISIIVFGFFELEELTTIITNASIIQIIVWTITGFFIGFGQEITFRGLIFTGIRKRFGFRMTNFLTTAIFILGTIHSVRLINYHFDGDTSDVFILITIYFFVGLLFGWIRETQKNVIVPAVIHAFGNAITWLAVFALI